MGRYVDVSHFSISSSWGDYVDISYFSISSSWGDYVDISYFSISSSWGDYVDIFYFSTCMSISAVSSYWSADFFTNTIMNSDPVRYTIYIRLCVTGSL